MYIYTYSVAYYESGEIVSRSDVEFSTEILKSPEFKKIYKKSCGPKASEKSTAPILT